MGENKVKVKQSYLEAYELGQKLNKKYDDITDAYCDQKVEEIVGWNFHGVKALFFRSGFKGYEMPQWVKGWRYGNIPECGFSMNYKENTPEDGISMMEVTLNNGEILAVKDEISKLFIIGNNRSVVKCEGWLNTCAKGSDGESLLVGAEEIID
jgi:hypothetical protein